MKSKIIRMLGCLLLGGMLLGSMAGCGGGAKDMSIANIRERGVLRIAVPDYETPFFYKDEESGAYAGCEAELAEVIANALGVTVEYVAAKKEAFVGKLSTGDADIAFGSIAIGSSEAEGYLESTGYATGYVYMVTKKGLYAGDLGIFEGKGIGVSALVSSLSERKLYSIRNATILRYDSLTTVKKDFSQQRIIGYVCYQKEAEELLATGEYQVQDMPTIEGENYCILTPMYATSLMSGINQLIQRYLTQQEEAGEPQE